MKDTHEFGKGTIITEKVTKPHLENNQFNNAYETPNSVTAENAVGEIKIARERLEDMHAELLATAERARVAGVPEDLIEAQLALVSQYPPR